MQRQNLNEIKSQIELNENSIIKRELNTKLKIKLMLKFN